MEEPKNNNEKGKNITILGSKSIAVPDVFKLDIMALLHKHKIREKRRMKHSSIDQAPLY